MNYLQKNHGFVLKIRSTTSIYFIYVILLFVLAYLVWPKFQTTQFSIYHYILDFEILKLIVCFSVAIVMWFIVNNYYSENNSFSGRVILLLTMLYFIPGLAICGALNVAWLYIILYIVYYIVLIFADYVIRQPKRALISIEVETAKGLEIGMIVFCLLYPFVLMLLFNKSFSISEFLLTMNDPYGVRAEAREKSISWAYLIFEYWGVYFGAVMITFSIKQKKRFVAIAFTVVELFYFTLQGNRIILFITIIAIVLGFLKINNKGIAVTFVALLIMQFIEFALFKNTESIGMVINVFRRFTIVPNVIAPHYYDYFLSATPDYLRGHFPNISSLFGTSSPYDFNIGYIIGEQYFNMQLNGNTGLVGGAFFEFGILGVFIDPIMLVVCLRLFEKILMRADDEIVMIIALIFASLAINSWAIWSQCVRLSYIPVFIISMYILFNKSDQSKKAQ